MQGCLQEVVGINLGINYKLHKLYFLLDVHGWRAVNDSSKDAFIGALVLLKGSQLPDLDEEPHSRNSPSGGTMLLLSANSEFSCK